MNICEYLCDVKIFRYTLCVKCHVILLCITYKSLHNLFYCKNYVVSNVVSSQILCFLNLCYYKSSIEFDSTGNVKFMYIQLFQNPCSVMYDPNPIHKHEAICLQISSGFVI